MNTPSTFQSIESPCIKICDVDQRTGLCGGCHRSLDEIASWSSFSHAQRRAIMQVLPSRAPGFSDSKRA
jgi:uncharacterized protein